MERHYYWESAAAELRISASLLTVSISLRRLATAISRRPEGRPEGACRAEQGSAVWRCYISFFAIA